MADDPNPPEPTGGDDKMTNEQITENLFGALSGDEKLTDDDRRTIAEGLATKTGGKVPDPVAPTAEHWSTKKLF